MTGETAGFMYHKPGKSAIGPNKASNYANINEGFSNTGNRANHSLTPRYNPHKGRYAEMEGPEDFKSGLNNDGTQSHQSNDANHASSKGHLK